jgi:hypothetical protein
MKTKKILVSILALSIVCCIGTSVFAGRGGSQGSQTGAGLVPLTEAEADTLKFMREEEKLARDVYTVMYQSWGAAIFSNIAESEQRHMDALKSLLDKYGLTDPASSEVGVFVDPELQDLYDDLISRGERSLLDAVMVGALIEEVDIEDLQSAIQGTSRIELQAVYGNLLDGSINHLKAFVSHIEVLGVDYVAQHLTQEEVDALLAQ